MRRQNLLPFIAILILLIANTVSQITVHRYKNQVKELTIAVEESNKALTLAGETVKTAYSVLKEHVAAARELIRADAKLKTVLADCMRRR